VEKGNISIPVVSTAQLRGRSHSTTTQRKVPGIPNFLTCSTTVAPTCAGACVSPRTATVAGYLLGPVPDRGDDVEDLLDGPIEPLGVLEERHGVTSLAWWDHSSTI
jgi:hypothetical protein